MITIDSKSLSKQWLEYQHRKQERPDLYRLKSTGIKKLDEVLGGGIEPGQYVLIGGAQKSGKTTLLSCMAESFAKQGLNVLFLSAEMTNIQMIGMFFSRLSKIERMRIRCSNLDDSDWVRLERASDIISEYQIWWNHGFSTIEDIYNIISEIEIRENIIFDAVFLDYIQLMEASGKIKSNRVQELEEISRALKRLTIMRKNPFIVIAAAQINRESIRGKLYDANAFLGSGSLERDMDIGMMIYSVEEPLRPGVVMKDRKKISIVGSRETAMEPPFDVFYNGGTAQICDIIEPDSIDATKIPW